MHLHRVFNGLYAVGSERDSWFRARESLNVWGSLHKCCRGGPSGAVHMTHIHGSGRHPGSPNTREEPTSVGRALLEGSVPHLSKDSAPGDIFYECLGQKFQIKPETVKRNAFFFFFLPFQKQWWELPI